MLIKQSSLKEIFKFDKVIKNKNKKTIKKSKNNVINKQ